MRDVLMLLSIAAFFALCVAYVWWCDRIIGPDPADLESVSPDTRSNAVAVTQNLDDEVPA
jgi:hypothetical protein